MTDWIYVSIGAGLCLALAYKATFWALGVALRRWGKEGEQGA